MPEAYAQGQFMARHPRENSRRFNAAAILRYHYESGIDPPSANAGFHFDFRGCFHRTGATATSIAAFAG
jgi:hypothetical protein